MNQKVIIKAIKTYGREAQMRQCIEEMAELTQAICKHFRITDKENVDVKEFKENYASLVDETADVYIMIQQMIHMIGAEDIFERVNFKIDRLEKRLEEKNE